MDNLNQGASAGWHASLSLRFGLSNGKTALKGRAHRGPLQVQKPLYPEGHDLCHTVILHPPGGIAGGDTLDMDIEAEGGAKVLITTPGSSKWYRAGGRPARQRVQATLRAGALLEWLPQETIFFDGVQAALTTEVKLDFGATFLGLETFCLGRIAAGETFRQGSISITNRIERNGTLLWLEQGRLTGGSPLIESAIGLAGYPFSATLLATGPPMERSVLEVCRTVPDPEGTLCGLTLLPCGLLVARCLANQTEPVREWFLALWAVLRPLLVGRPAAVPRIWNT